MPNSAKEEDTAPRLLASFGRRRGRRLRTTKQDLWETLLPQLEISLPDGPLNPKELFPTQTETWLEIGFGGGEHLAHQATLYPHAGIIGCEPYMNGIAGLLAHIEKNDTKNIRVYGDDARFLMEKLPDASISKAFILYPDPWPKARHKKRRLVSTPTLNVLARILKSGAQLRLATDDDDYCTWMLEHILPHPAFEWQAKTCTDWLTAPSDWITTRYEQKKAVNRGLTPSYLNFTRK